MRLPSPKDTCMYVYTHTHTHQQTYTVEPLLSGHPRGIGNWPLNRGWPLNKGSSGIKFWLRENVNLFKYKHALSFLTIVTFNTAITLSSKKSHKSSQEYP